MLLCGEYCENVYAENAYKLSIVQAIERRIVCTPLGVNVFVTLAALTFELPL
jgi:hypothetical protein